MRTVCHRCDYRVDKIGGHTVGERVYGPYCQFARQYQDYHRHDCACEGVACNHHLTGPTQEPSQCNCGQACYNSERAIQVRCKMSRVSRQSLATMLQGDTLEVT